MFKMTECDSYETNKIYPSFTSFLSDDQQFRQNKINQIRDYFVQRLKKEN